MGLENLFSGTNTQDIAHPIAWLPAGLYGKLVSVSRWCGSYICTSPSLFDLQESTLQVTIYVCIYVMFFVIIYPDRLLFIVPKTGNSFSLLFHLMLLPLYILFAVKFTGFICAGGLRQPEQIIQPRPFFFQLASPHSRSFELAPFYFYFPPYIYVEGLLYYTHRCILAQPRSQVTSAHCCVLVIFWVCLNFLSPARMLLVAFVRQSDVYLYNSFVITMTGSCTHQFFSNLKLMKASASFKQSHKK